MHDDHLDDKTMKSFKLFLEEVLAEYRHPLHSVYITGSLLTADFDPKLSDINSVFVLNRMDLQFLSVLAPLGKKYGKKGIAAPLIMTPDYIKRSLDVFPIEFLNLKQLHHKVLGEDIFQDIKIERTDLRYQCERELKVKLMGLRQAYIRSAGDRKVLSENIISSIPAYIPLCRAVIFLLGKAPPGSNEEVLAALQEMTKIDIGAFQRVLRHKKERSRLSLEELDALFRDYYHATEKLGEIIDAAVA
ncbi:MAG: hypothetical protein P1P89_13590 [Desulfobacterales bacterium]|nr:hypothetical protein [Desulfobacterales bacterium]